MKKPKVYKLLAGAFFLLAVFFSLLAIKEYVPFLKSAYNLENLRQVVVKDIKEQDVSVDENELRYIDFEMLNEINPDIIGWLYIPQIGVDQPILKGSYDTQYLSNGYDGKYNYIGSIFTWADANESLSDENVFLFGHNMSSGQMFGNLDYFQSQEFLENNKRVYVYTPSKVRVYEVMDTVVRHKHDPIFSEKKSIYKDSQQLNLCTCTGYVNTPQRLVVRCKNIKTINALKGQEGEL